MRAQLLLSLMASAATATIQGFNYGSTNADGSVRNQQDFQSQFAAAKQVANGDFTSARLYTMIAGGSQSDPIGAIPAAIATNTRLLLGMWASSGQETMTNEIAALKAAITKYGSKFTSLVDGISVGSEDLYRITPTSKANDPTLVGAGPDTIVDYISQVRKAIAGTALSGAKIGHVDTWTAWADSSNAAVVDAVDWIGNDLYPYFEDQKPNAISNSKVLFDSAMSATKAASKGKPVWVTETGWPTGGNIKGAAVPSTENAQNYWEAVGCGELFGQVNTWWFTYFDGAPNPTFGLVEAIGQQPKYDLSCSKKSTLINDATKSSADSSSSSNSSSSSSEQASGSATGSSASSPTDSTGGSPATGSGATGTGSSSSSSSSSGDAGATGAGSTNAACLFGLIATALLAVAAA